MSPPIDPLPPITQGDSPRETFIGSKQIRTRIRLMRMSSYLCYISALFTTSFSLMYFVKMDWLKAIFLPLAGVSVIYWGVKLFLWKLSHAKTPLYPVVKYSVGVIGIGCAVAWLYYYFKISDLAEINRNFDQMSKMIYFGALGEVLVGVFLYCQSLDLKQKYTLTESNKSN